MKIEGQKLKVESRKWKVLAWLLFLAFNFQLSTPNCLSATKVFLRDIYPEVMATAPGWDNRLLNATQGSAVASYTMNSIAGPLTGHYWPMATSGYILKYLTTNQTIFVSLPLSSGVTISGVITPNIWGFESAVQCNCAFRYEVLRWSAAAGGIVSSLGISTDNGVSEWGTTAAVRTSPTLTPTSTAFNTGDRIILVIYNDDGNGVTEASGRTWTLRWNGATGVDGDSYLSFTETISFGGTNNNARPIPAFAGMTAIPVPIRSGGIARLLRPPSDLLRAVSELEPLPSWWADFWEGALVRGETGNSKLGQFLRQRADSSFDKAVTSNAFGGKHVKR